jgi:hypothetical protein
MMYSRASGHAGYISVVVVEFCGLLLLTVGELAAEPLGVGSFAEL